MTVRETNPVDIRGVEPLQDQSGLVVRAKCVAGDQIGWQDFDFLLTLQVNYGRSLAELRDLIYPLIRISSDLTHDGHNIYYLGRLIINLVGVAYYGDRFIMSGQVTPLLYSLDLAQKFRENAVRMETGGQPEAAADDGSPRFSGPPIFIMDDPAQRPRWKPFAIKEPDFSIRRAWLREFAMSAGYPERAARFFARMFQEVAGDLAEPLKEFMDCFGFSSSNRPAPEVAQLDSEISVWRGPPTHCRLTWPDWEWVMLRYENGAWIACGGSGKYFHMAQDAMTPDPFATLRSRQIQIDVPV